MVMLKIFSDVQDEALNTRNLTEYSYDAFGRRIETAEYLGDRTRTLYDGFSFDIAEKKVLNRTASFDVSVKTRAGSAAAQTQTRGTKIINGTINLGRSFLNNFRTEKNQKDLYGYYTTSEVKVLTIKPSDNVSKWINENNVPENYYNQGCTK